MTGTVAEELVLLRGQVDYLLQRNNTVEGMTARPVNWRALDAEQATAAWAALCEWTDWLTEHYRLQESVPSCWYAHPPIHEELSALRVSWVGTFRDDTATSGSALAWHESLEKVLARIRELDVAGCASAATHRPDIAPADIGADTRERDAAIHADISSRPQPAPPPASVVFDASDPAEAVWLDEGGEDPSTDETG